MNMKIEYTESSGNVYQDLGFLDAEEQLVKAKRAHSARRLGTLKVAFA